MSLVDSRSEVVDSRSEVVDSRSEPIIVDQTAKVSSEDETSCVSYFITKPADH